MLLRKTVIGAAVGLVAIGLALSGASRVCAQTAGVIVSPEGVLQVKTFDRTGALNRQRLAAAKEALPPELSRPTRLRYVALRRLETEIAKRIENGAGVTDEMRFLAGLTRIQYVFFYPESGEIVVAGPAEGFGQDISGRAVGLTSGRAVLELQDLIVALRAYAPSGTPTKMIGCSIDPSQEGLKKMRDFLVRISGQVTPNDAQRIAAGLRENLGLQTVTVMGVSPKTHFAQVLVEADYRMKLIGIGLERPPAHIVSYVAKARPADVARNALQRWYFVPNYDTVRVSDDGLAMELVGDGVKLIGENERVQDDGTRVATKNADRASQLFTKSFTAKYPELARNVPVYAQLRNLIDISVAAAFIQQQDYYAKAGWAMEVLGDEALLPVETYAVPEQVETAVNAVWKGPILMTPVGGGVNIQPTEALRSDRLLADENGKLDATHEAAETLPQDATRWWWD